MHTLSRNDFFLDSNIKIIKKNFKFCYWLFKLYDSLNFFSLLTPGTNDTCTCLVSGLSRYRTYDGQMLNYVATCPIELTRTIDSSNPSSFAVYGTTLYNNEQMMMFGTRRYRTVNVTINGLNIYMDTIGDIYVSVLKVKMFSLLFTNIIIFFLMLLYQVYGCKERAKHRVANQTTRRQVKNLTTVSTNKRNKNVLIIV